MNINQNTISLPSFVQDFFHNPDQNSYNETIKWIQDNEDHLQNIAQSTLLTLEPIFQKISQFENKNNKYSSVQKISEKIHALVLIDTLGESEENFMKNLRTADKTDLLCFTNFLK